MVKISQLVLGTLIATASLVGCAQTPQQGENAANQAPELPQVVATSMVLCDLTQQIAQATVALTCLMPANQDPHTYSPTPSDRKAIENADLVLYGGYSSEPGLIKLIEATNTDAAKIAVYEAAVPSPLMGEEHHHEEGADHEGADQEAETAEAHEAAGERVADPHVWHDAKNGVQIVAVIQENLTKLIPDQATRYQQNATALSQQLTQIDSWIKTQVATIPEANRKLVTTHEALGYYANAYGFELEGAIEGVSTEAKPSAARVSTLVDQLKAAEVPAIFVETTTNPKLLETVAQEANVKVAEPPLYIEGPGGENTTAPTYQTMLTANTCTVVNALGGKCDQSTAPAKP